MGKARCGAYEHNWNEEFIEKNYFEHFGPTVEKVAVDICSIISSNSNSQCIHAVPLFQSISISTICYSFGKGEGNGAYYSKKDIECTHFAPFPSSPSLLNIIFRSEFFSTVVICNLLQPLPLSIFKYRNNIHSNIFGFTLNSILRFSSI